jgi:hypothetical protein
LIAESRPFFEREGDFEYRIRPWMGNQIQIQIRREGFRFDRCVNDRNALGTLVWKNSAIGNVLSVTFGLLLFQPNPRFPEIQLSRHVFVMLANQPRLETLAARQSHGSYGNQNRQVH